MSFFTARRNHRLILAIAAFVLLDLGTLAFNFQIARLVEQDALAINLAGRQRMLSQRTTKAALLATLPWRSGEQRAQATAEALEAWRLFRTTLDAFADGGQTAGGHGQAVILHAVEGRAAVLVRQARELVARLPADPGPAGIDALAQFASEHNIGLLRLMNELTSELEAQSVAAVFRLRVAQTLAFSLSLGNFFLILLQMQRSRRQAEQDAVTDALTGLYNRGGLYAGLEGAIARYQQEQRPLGVILLDLDGFKAVNDHFGHAAGDAALVETARRISQWAQAHWLAGRLGGDEFAVICPDTDAARLADAAAQLTTALADIRVGSLSVSASVGHASAEALQPCSADGLMAQADAAMFTHKYGKRRSHGYRGGQRIGPEPH